MIALEIEKTFQNFEIFIIPISPKIALLNWDCYSVEPMFSWINLEYYKIVQFAMIFTNNSELTATPHIQSFMVW